MIKDDLSGVEESATKSTYKLGVSFKRCGDKDESSAPKFVPSSNYYKEEEALKPTKTNQPSNPKSSFNPKRELRKETPKPREEAFVCMFVAVRVTWMSFASGVRGLRGGVLIMPETHIVTSFLIFRLTLSLALCLTLLLLLCLSLLIYLTIAPMVLVHERTTLSLDVSVMAHVLIVVIVFRVGLFFLLEGLTLTLSRDTWTVHVFPIVVHVPLSQVMLCRGL
jgi:hypothetical protein